MMQREPETEVVDAVHHIANRYGVRGLEDLIALAEEELVVARRALEQLAADSD
ncbi:hypothetical protein GON03_05085 [Nocardioides sp. MAH-18]|uniref:Uncharacterized protein n=1 Tax=Nocardioides agri TaxID=2682843 RepID=A0A6L6XSE7_9ACTN|nr:MULTISPECIES: hypothetical protein [unclassified Nocardioides]MBA2953681.1 hypothetical protein [Nocardioides sp. CGMCC 1.13656]MVQ48545.1 hypothetical protein [Nocardioides sp. MAH-18]